jgi:DNA repair protein RadC
MVYLQDSKIHVQGSEHVAKVFQDLLLLEDMIDQQKEHFYVMHLDTRSRINMVELVSVGTLTSSLVHPRETFRRAVMQGSANIIVAHNHPSGEVDPSDEDTNVTKLLFEAGNILGIKMLDHVIFSKGMFFCFRDNRVHQMTEGKMR